jgi:hypothetical protein
MLGRINIIAVEQLLKWEHLLQDIVLDVLMETFKLVF